MARRDCEPLRGFSVRFSGLQWRSPYRSSHEAPVTTARRTKRRARSPTEWGTALREAGLRRTGARVAVLARLDAATAPLTHTDVVEMLVRLGYDRATLYRNLMDLGRCGSRHPRG